MPQPYQDELLERNLRSFLGESDPEAVALLRRKLQWVEVAAGDALMRQGEPGDAMYLSISGRLRAYVRDDDGVEQMVREMARGQVIGEMSLFTDEPRSATVVAIRDSVLVRLDKSDFKELLASSAQMSIALTRQMIKRLQTRHTRSSLDRPVVIALLPITSGVALHEFSEKLATQLRRRGKVQLVFRDGIERELLESGPVADDPAPAQVNRHVSLYLDQIEAENDYVLLVADDGPTAWTQRCIRSCDEILLLADAARPPQLHEIESECLMRRPGRTEAAETLVLLHPADLKCPSGTRQWLARRPVADHIHIRPALERDMARLARIQSGTAIGLVLAGGGARGCAHLGIWQALHERGIDIDYVGGTSIGSVMATLLASDRPLDQLMKIARKAFSINPTGDFNLVPLLSIIAGRRLRRVIDTAVQDLLGHDADVEDLWKNFYCVATNYTQASEHLVRRGNLVRGILASIAIPGALPPVVHDGDLLCDGGTFNNFPVDVMRATRGVGKVIGVDLSFRRPRRIEHEQLPGSWALLRDRLRPRRQRRYKLPSLVAYLMNVTILYSTSRQRESQKLTDLYFNPPLDRVGMLQWDKFDSIAAQGHAHGREVLDALSPAQLAGLGATPPAQAASLPRAGAPSPDPRAQAWPQSSAVASSPGNSTSV